jgi:transposase InsO family protein
LKPRSYTKTWRKTQDLNLVDTKIPNLLKPLVTQSSITRPNQVWSSDFTYLKFNYSFVYLATVIDVYSKEIVGFHISSRHNIELVAIAFSKAIKQYGKTIISHSDQGSEYRSIQYLELLQKYGVAPSNSAKSSPWQNSFQESFYGKFKPELELNKLHPDSNFMDLYNYVANQIDYYNNYRIHTTIKDIPAKFRKRYEDLEYCFNQEIKEFDKTENLVFGEENLVSEKVGG